MMTSAIKHLLCTSIVSIPSLIKTATHKLQYSSLWTRTLEFKEASVTCAKSHSQGGQRQALPVGRALRTAGPRLAATWLPGQEGRWRPCRTQGSSPVQLALTGPSLGDESASRTSVRNTSEHLNTQSTCTLDPSHPLPPPMLPATPQPKCSYLSSRACLPPPHLP